MRSLEGRVAVVTGGASGIGRAMGERFGQEGMKVVLADVIEETLNTTVAEMRFCRPSSFPTSTSVPQQR